MLASSSDSRVRHLRVFTPRQLNGGGFGFDEPDTNDVPSPPTDDDDTGSGSGDTALQQLLSSQAAQFSSTAFNNLPTPTDSSLQPTVTPGADDSTSSSTATDFLLPTSTTQSLSTPTPTLAPTTTSNGNAITALPSITAAPASNTQASSNSSSTHKSSHSAAIGVTVTFLIIAICVVAFHFVRKRQISKRNSRRMTWNPPLFFGGNNPGEGANDMETGAKVGPEFETIDINEKLGPEALPDDVTYNSLARTTSPPHPVAAFAMPAAPPPLHPTGYAPPRMPSPPPIGAAGDDYGRNAPSPVGIDAPTFAGASAPLVSSTQFAPVAPLNVPRESLRSSASTPAIGLGLPIQLVPGALVVVARTFVPSLPDELPIQTGEQVRLVNRYDDGWAHVERMRSGAGVESGVVPLECLEAHSPTSGVNGAVPGMGLAQVAVEGWRLSKRESSLRNY